jgi:hypothetical protein
VGSRKSKPRRGRDSSDLVFEIGPEGELSLNEAPLTFPIPLGKLRELLGDECRTDEPEPAFPAETGPMALFQQMAARLRGPHYIWDSLGVEAFCARDEPERVTEVRLQLSFEGEPRDSDPKEAFTGTVRWHGREPATHATGYRPLYDEACEYLDRDGSDTSNFKLSKLHVYATLDHAKKRVTWIGLSGGSGKKKKAQRKKKASEPAAPTRAYDVAFDPAGRDGWAFGAPPGLTSEQWPTRDAVPLRHVFTVRIPEQYRCKGPEVVAMSVFQEAGDPARTRGRPKSQHARAVPLLDAIGVGWCLLYLTEDELRAPSPKHRGAKPAHERKPFKLVERTDDPNVGQHYVEFPDWLEGLKRKELEELSKVVIRGYVPMFSDLGKKLNLVRFFHPSHFGGTLHPSQGGPRGLSLFFFEFDEALGGANLGGDGVAQIDLLKGTLSWACG